MAFRAKPSFVKLVPAKGDNGSGNPRAWFRLRRVGAVPEYPVCHEPGPCYPWHRDPDEQLEDQGSVRQVCDAWKMLSIDESSISLNSASLCSACSPSVSAREKLAATPRFRDIRAFASSRV